MLAIATLLPHTSSAMEQTYSLSHGQTVKYEALSLGEKEKEEIKEGEKVLYACVAVAGPGLLLLGTSLYKKRKVENINYW